VISNVNHIELLSMAAQGSGKTLLSIEIATTDGNGRITREFDMLDRISIAQLCDGGRATISCIVL
jgi:hypothetical protein